MKLLLILMLTIGCNVTNEGAITINNNSEKNSSNNNGNNSNNGGNSSGGDTVSSGDSSGDSGSGSGSGIQTGNFQRTLTITNSSSASVDDVTLRLELDTSSLISAGKMNSDCRDIRMTYEGVQLSTWIGEESCNTTKTDIFFKIPNFPTGEISIDLYYGNLSLTSIHDGDATFPIYFDDFNRSDLFAKTINGNSYQVMSPSGAAVSGMGNFIMDYNSNDNKGKLKLNSGDFYNGYNNYFYINVNKSDSESIILSKKVKWITVGNASYLAGGLFFDNSNSFQGTWKYTDLTILYLQGGLFYYTGQGVVGAGIDYHISLELLNTVLIDRCWKNCNWTVSKNGTPQISSGTYRLGMLYPMLGNTIEIDYYLARRTLPSGDPVITIGSEQSN